MLLALLPALSDCMRLCCHYRSLDHKRCHCRERLDILGVNKTNPVAPARWPLPDSDLDLVVLDTYLINCKRIHRRTAEHRSCANVECRAMEHAGHRFLRQEPDA